MLLNSNIGLALFDPKYHDETNRELNFELSLYKIHFSMKNQMKQKGQIKILQIQKKK